MSIPQHGYGCILEAPDARDYLYEDIAGGGELPEEFVIDAPHMYQNGIDACVGFAIAEAKSVQEGEKLSPRYQWHLAKKEDLYRGWGASVPKTLKQLVINGALPYGTFDEDVSMSRDTYMVLEPTEEQKKQAQQYRAESYWRAGYGTRDLHVVKQALFEQKVPIVTSMQWFREYDQPVKGFLPKPVTMAYGHAFILKGWKRDKKGEYFVFQNSWQKTWGDKGDFYIYVDDLATYNLQSYYVITDIPSDRAKILARYQKQLIKNPDSPKVYYVSKDKIAWIKDEEMFYMGVAEGWWGGFDTVITIDSPITEDVTFNYVSRIS